MTDSPRITPIVAVVSGGNNDVSRYAEIVERALIHEGRKHYFLVDFPQEPGALRRFLNEILGPDDDIARFEYLKKSARNFGSVLIGIETTSPANLDALSERLAAESAARAASASMTCMTRCANAADASAGNPPRKLAEATYGRIPARAVPARTISRSAGLRSSRRAGFSQMSTSSPDWWLAWPLLKRPPAGIAMSPISTVPSAFWFAWLLRRCMNASRSGWPK
mgnify:CR=1 FL=1